MLGRSISTSSVVGSNRSCTTFVWIIVFVCVLTASLLEAQQVDRARAFTPPAVRKIFGSLEPARDGGAPPLGPLTDAGDFYVLGDGMPVQLMRASDELAVRFAGTLSAKEGLQRLEAVAGIGQLQLSRTVDFRGTKRIDILRSIGGNAALDARAAAALPYVEYAYPVLVDPASLRRMIPTDEVLVRLPDGMEAADVAADIAAAGLEVVRRIRTSRMRVYLLRLVDPKRGDALEASRALFAGGNVLWAQPNFIRELQLSFTPNDPLFDLQQHLHNTGQNGATVDADVDAPEAWDISTGDAGVVIAIVDSGVDTAHADLSIFHNPGESGGGKETNGIDDDGNGYIDDYQGWDFYNDDNNPNPGGTNAHGTACAGVAAAAGDNATLVAGIAYECKILPVKVSDDSGYFASDLSLGEALSYAADFADVLSNSWGGGGTSPFINNGIDDAVTNGRDGKGSPVFFASGNYVSTWNYGGGRWRSPLSAAGISGNYYFGFYFERGPSSGGENAVRIDNVCLLDGTGYWHDSALPRQDFEGSFPPSGWSLYSSGGGDWYRSNVNASKGCGGSYSARSPSLTNGQAALLLTPLVYVNGDETLAFNYSLSMPCDSAFYLDVYDSDGYYLGSYGPVCGLPTLMSSVSYPASYVNGIAVGAATDCDYRADYSQYGTSLDFVAPSNGGWNDIVTLDPTGGVGWTSTNYMTEFGGTSSACPLAAGVGALLLSECPDLTASDVRTIMRDTCDQIGGVSYPGGFNLEYGYGRINAASALAALPGAPTITQQPAAQEVCEGELVQFFVSATGSGSLSYQWQRSTNGGGNWADVEGATGSSYSFTAQAGDDGNQYRCRVSGQCGASYSDPAALVVWALASLAASDPPPDGTLPRGDPSNPTNPYSNMIRLTFDLSVAPRLLGGPPLSVVPLGGGADVGSSFVCAADPNDAMTLTARENGTVLTNLQWYRVSPAAGFCVAPFALDLCTLVGDCDGSGRVTTIDYSCVKAMLGARGDLREDLNGDGRVTTTDYSIVKANLGTRTPTKPAP